MKTKGAFEYTDDHEEIVLGFVKNIPQTTNKISQDMKEKKVFENIHPKTAQRLLQSLYKKGKIKKFRSGRTTLWQK